MAWNLSEYETAAELNQWWIDNFPAGRLEVEAIYFNATEQEILIKASAYRDMHDEKPCAVNFARGRASDYPKNMQRWYVEDTTTSAIARVILLVKGASKTAHREAMEQVKREQPKPQRSSAVTDPGLPSTFVAVEDDEVVLAKNAPEAPLWDDSVTYLTEQLGASPISEDLKCSHGLMLLREGTSKAGKPYKGSMCPGKTKGDRCQETLDGRPLRDGALWWVMSPQGFWELPR